MKVVFGSFMTLRGERVCLTWLWGLDTGAPQECEVDRVRGEVLGGGGYK